MLHTRTPLKRTQMRRTPAKRASAAERRHMDRVAEMGCLVCGADAEVHHVHSDGYQRLTKTNRRVAPLCPWHHRQGPDAVHSLGHGGFTITHGIDLLAWADREWENSNGATEVF